METDTIGESTRYLFRSIVIISLFNASCSTVEQAQERSTSPTTQVREVAGFQIYEGLEPEGAYSVVGFIEFESPVGRSRESIDHEIKGRSVAMGGNAVIKLAREPILETTTPAASYDLGMGRIDDLASSTVIERDRWSATVILLQ